MFEDLDEAGLVATIADATCAEAAAGALRSSAIGELAKRRVGDDADDPRAWWVCDIWDSTAAEIAAAMNISHRKASGQMRIAETLRDHLPRLADLYRQGRLSARLIAAIAWRTRLITDEAVWALIDAELASHVQAWGPLADDKLTAEVDALVYRFDRDAVIAKRESARTRDFTVGCYDDEAGVTAVWGTLLAADAAVLDKRVKSMAATVCADDPRSIGERRSDAAGAWANGNNHLPCACGSPTCPATAQHPAPQSSVVVHVIADQAAIDAAQTAGSDQGTPTTAGRQDMGTAILSGTEMLPTAMLAALLRGGAKLRPLTPPDEAPEPGYRPSAKLARFIRARDMTCRFPGCTVPAEFCDIDHVIPYPIGVTHPSNLACLCRKHHHLKTFWIGDWQLTLYGDGTAIWTAPTGHTYTSYPGSRTYFPHWNTTTAERSPAPDIPPAAATGRGLKMPTRKRTRAAERDARIKAERAQNNSGAPPF